MKFLTTFQTADFLDTLVSLGTAFVLGTIIGAERQYRQRTAGLRLSIALELPPGLDALPWEALYDLRGSTFLACDPRTVLVRSSPREGLPIPPRPAKRLRVLVVILLVLSFPVLEAWLLFELGERFGVWVVVWLVAAAIVGLMLIRLERLVWAIRLAGSLREQRSPLRALLRSARAVVVGVLLIFPGVISDVMALVLWVWPIPKDEPMTDDARPAVIEGEFRRESERRLPPER